MKNKEWYVTITQGEVESIKDSSQLLIYIAIKSYCANGKRDFDVSTRDIKSRCHLSLGTITKNLPQVISNKFVEIVSQESRRGGKVNVYRCVLATELSLKESVRKQSLSVHRAASKNFKYKTSKNDLALEEFADEIFSNFPTNDEDHE